MKHRATPRFVALAASWPPLRRQRRPMRAQWQLRRKIEANHVVRGGPDWLGFHYGISRTRSPPFFIVDSADQAERIEGRARCNIFSAIRFSGFSLSDLEFAVGLGCRDDHVLGAAVAAMRIAQV